MKLLLDQNLSRRMLSSLNAVYPDSSHVSYLAMEEGGIDNLISKSRKSPNPHNRVSEATEQAVTEYAIEQPAHGQVRVSNELRKVGIFVSPGGVRSIWIRNYLGNFCAIRVRVKIQYFLVVNKLHLRSLLIYGTLTLNRASGLFWCMLRKQELE